MQCIPLFNHCTGERIDEISMILVPVMRCGNELHLRLAVEMPSNGRPRPEPLNTSPTILTLFLHILLKFENISKHMNITE